MEAALMALALFALPVISFVALFAGLNWLTGGDPPRPLQPLLAARQHQARRRHVEPEPLPTVLLGLELRRIAADVHRIETGCQPHRAARLEAAMAAYDTVLLQLAVSNDVPTPPHRPPLSARSRLEVETGLVSSGVDW
ncbi:MAG: hypothetical protein ACRCSN_21080 [Dermatophilaceae bacterium]